MSSNSLFAGALHPAARCLVVMAVVAPSLLFSPAHAYTAGDITVESVQGEAHLREGGTERRLRKGTIVLVPAAVRTGHDGTAELKQDTTLVSVGPDTILDFPAPERDVNFDRIVQSQGNAFYDVGKRESRKLRVETPYLVAVIKGTQFSVSVQGESTSISLIEGSLEILSTEGGAFVNLEAGEIATRRRSEPGITVVDGIAVRVVTPATGDLAARVGNAGGGANVAVAVGVDLDIATVAGVGASLPVNVAAAIDLGTAGVGIDTEANVRVGDARDVGAGASIDLDAGGAAVDVGGSVDVGDVTAVDLGAGIDLGEGGATVDIGAGVDVGDAASVDLDTGVDVGASGATVDVGGDVDVGSVSADVDVGADLDSGTVDVGLEIGPVELDVGLDLGLGEGDGTQSAETDDSGGVVEELVEDVGGLLGGLLGGGRSP